MFRRVLKGEILLFSESAMIQSSHQLGCGEAVFGVTSTGYSRPNSCSGLRILSNNPAMINLKSNDADEITGAQIRAARAFIRWSAKDLALAARVGVATVSRAEVEDGRPTITAANLKAIKIALETTGIEFLVEAGGGVGVLLKKPSP
jgi:DNA-binding transcriptional regulator YiaG